MKVMTVLGTRPEIIRLCRIIPQLDELCDHILVHTGQNYDRTLNDIFFNELEVRAPDHVLEANSESLAEQLSAIFTGCEKLLKKFRPDKFLVLGDTNSSLSTIVAKRLGIQVYHLEAGNRCYDDRVPEEVNRRLIDHASDILMPYTERSRANLLKEGIASNRVFVTGNPIYEVLEHHKPRIEKSAILSKLSLKKGEYFLLTLHRAENVDVGHRMEDFVHVSQRLFEHYGIPVVCSLHPRTRSQLLKQKRSFPNEAVRTIDPVGLYDFVKLEQNAFCVLTDSGTVQEECSIFHIPNVTLRDTTERPETVEVGSNIISGCNPESILRGVKAAVGGNTTWQPPQEYSVQNVSRTVVKIIMSYFRADEL